MITRTLPRHYPEIFKFQLCRRIHAILKNDYSGMYTFGKISRTSTAVESIIRTVLIQYSGSQTFGE